MGHWGTCTPSTFNCLIYLVTSEPHNLWNWPPCGCLLRKEYRAYRPLSLFIAWIYFIIFYMSPLNSFIFLSCPSSHQILAMPLVIAVAIIFFRPSLTIVRLSLFVAIRKFIIIMNSADDDWRTRRRELCQIINYWCVVYRRRWRAWMLELTVAPIILHSSCGCTTWSTECHSSPFFSSSLPEASYWSRCVRPSGCVYIDTTISTRPCTSYLYEWRVHHGHTYKL